MSLREVVVVASAEALLKLSTLGASFLVVVVKGEFSLIGMISSLAVDVLGVVFVSTVVVDSCTVDRTRIVVGNIPIEVVPCASAGFDAVSAVATMSLLVEDLVEDKLCDMA